MTLKPAAARRWRNVQQLRAKALACRVRRGSVDVDLAWAMFLRYRVVLTPIYPEGYHGLRELPQPRGGTGKDAACCQPDVCFTNQTRMAGRSMPSLLSTRSFSCVEVGVSSGAPNWVRTCTAVIVGKASTTCCTVIDPLTSAGSAGAAGPVPPSSEGVLAWAVTDVPVVAHSPAAMNPKTTRLGITSKAMTYIATGTRRVCSLVCVGTGRRPRGMVSSRAGDAVASR